MNFKIGVGALTLALASVGNAYAIQDCSQAVNDTEVLKCSTANRNEAEEGLNEEYVKAKERIEQIFGHEPTIKKEYLDTFVNAQRAWLKFRDYQCALKAHPAAEGSNVRLDFTNECISQLDAERTKTLQEMPYEQ